MPRYAAIAALRERAHLLGPHERAGHRLLELRDARPDTAVNALRFDVLANALALAALGDAADFERLELLVRHHGHQRVAHLQAEIDMALRSGPGLPITTALCRQLVGAGHDLAACWLLIADIPGGPAALPSTSADVRRLVDEAGADAWRRALAVVSGNPWGPDVAGLAELAGDAGLPRVREVVEWCAALYRVRFEEAERLEVAREIRRLVAISGCSQRQFAQYVGTSPSRLSTYVNGLVTPSAAMMVRIRRSASSLAQEESWTGGLHT